MANQLRWEELSRYTEPIRWLIEIAAKHGGATKPKADHSQFDLLVELARAVYEWDMAWECIAHSVIPHEITIADDSSVTVSLTTHGFRAMEAYRQALMPGMAEAEQERFNMFQSASEQLSIQEIIDRMDLKELDEPLRLARGYSMGDWIKFALGIIGSFSDNEYWRAPRKAELIAYLRNQCELDPPNAHCLLRDYGLSGQLLSAIDIEQIFPVANARRDSRLLRRPVVVVENQGQEHCVYGVETVSLGFQMILARIESGRIEFLNQGNDRQLNKAIGPLQKQWELHIIVDAATWGCYNRAI